MEPWSAWLRWKFFVGARRSDDLVVGVQPYVRITRSASRKLRNRLATSRSCRNSRWNSARSSAFHAIVSVMAKEAVRTIL